MCVCICVCIYVLDVYIFICNSAGISDLFNFFINNYKHYKLNEPLHLYSH